MTGMIWLDAAACLGALHVIGPIVVRFTLRFSASCRPNKVFLEDLPLKVAEVFRQRMPELKNLGFEHLGNYDCGSLTPETRSYLAYFANRNTNDFASVCALVTPKKTMSYLEFSTSFANGLNLETNTNATVPLTPESPSHRVWRFPKIGNAEALYRLHRRLLQKYAPRLWPLEATSSHELDRYVSVIENYGPRHRRIGYMRLSEDGQWYELTWKGACLMTWRGLWPTSMICRLLQRRAMQGELEGLQVRGTTAVQKA